MTDSFPHALVISDGRRGIENQALGLAEAAAHIRSLTISTHHIQNDKTFAALPPALQFALRRSPHDYGLTGLKPDIAIGCGRQAIAPLRALKRAHGADVFTVYVQDPQTSLSHFDLVIAPQHDGVNGDNIFAIVGSPNRITAPRLTHETEIFAPRLAQYPAPYAAILIGGASKRWSVKQEDMAAWHDAMRDLHVKGYSLLVTPSRRTPDFARKMLAQFAYEHGRVWLHDDAEDNPYFAFLNAADIILVTEDSTNMMTEACVTGKPVYRLPVSGDPGKFAILFDSLQTRCGVTRYEPASSPQSYEALSETRRAADYLWKRFDQVRASRPH
ncbi:mitochondrial fission ELM1 family protein [Robiginitomaculum antarcticum]|uniref:mitochondrial fission ELM1 family protein n=1 Tax=Robiginitomaculum antarcticum TaxID=437507 RepID=UPI00036511FA|nr:mitochondrial fission ELM1 family protein [Robiginitomaculum antarcticum]